MIPPHCSLTRKTLHTHFNTIPPSPNDKANTTTTICSHLKSVSMTHCELYFFSFFSTFFSSFLNIDCTDVTNMISQTPPWLTEQVQKTQQGHLVCFSSTFFFHPFFCLNIDFTDTMNVFATQRTPPHMPSPLENHPRGPNDS